MRMKFDSSEKIDPQRENKRGFDYYHFNCKFRNFEGRSFNKGNNLVLNDS